MCDISRLLRGRMMPRRRRPERHKAELLTLRVEWAETEALARGTLHISFRRSRNCFDFPSADLVLDLILYFLFSILFLYLVIFFAFFGGRFLSSIFLKLF